MEWSSFRQVLIEAEVKRGNMLDDLPEYRDFLNKSELIISLGSIHLSFKKDPELLDAKSIVKLLATSDVNNEFARLINMLEELEAEERRSAGQKKFEVSRELNGNITKVKSEIKAFPKEQLTVHDDIAVEIIYPSIKMEAIKSIKAHRLVNLERTCQCGACIRTILV